MVIRLDLEINLEQVLGHRLGGLTKKNQQCCFDKEDSGKKSMA